MGPIELRDATGERIEVGDYVAYARQGYERAYLTIGEVSSFSPPYVVLTPKSGLGVATLYAHRVAVIKNQEEE